MHEMEEIMRRKKKGFWKPIAAGFAVMYLATMGLATGLVKERFVQEDGLRFESAASAILDRADEKEFSMEQEMTDEQETVQEQEIAGEQKSFQEQEDSDRQEDAWSREKRKSFYQDLANNSFWRVNSEYMQISIAAYDEHKDLLAKSRDEIGSYGVSTTGREEWYFALDDYLSSEEKEVLAKYQAEDIQYCLQEPDVSEKYRFSIRVSPDLKELWEIYVQEIVWEEDKEEEGEKEAGEESGDEESGDEESDGKEAYMDPLTGGYHFMSGRVVVDYASGEEMEGARNFHEVSGEVVWKWTNPNVDKEKLGEGEIVHTELTLPYLNLYQAGTLAQWQRWTNSNYLQGFQEQGEFVWEEGIEVPPLMIEEDGICRRGKMQLQVGMIGEPFAYLEIRMESRPWLAAVDYMKYVYLAGAVLTAACMLAVIGMMNKVYARQAALEETRRDFTNAMAHELKTPLGVIRNFAENLLEHHKEEKRDYYLSQIIGQTEEMDRLVGEMIEVSKLDSEKLVLAKEEVSFLALLQEELGRFEPMIEEKKIQVEFSVWGDKDFFVWGDKRVSVQEDREFSVQNEDFLVQGDRDYLAKAVWNLLANAVDYNREGGKIFIQVDKEQCVIENSGEAMGEEALLHAFDLFYTSDKSRTGKDGHMGMGLYLAKKILELHHLKLVLSNVEGGVRVAVCRERG